MIIARLCLPTDDAFDGLKHKNMLIIISGFQQKTFDMKSVITYKTIMKYVSCRSRLIVSYFRMNN